MHLMKCGKSYEGVVHTEYVVLGFWHKMVLASNLGYPLCNCVYLKISPCYKMQCDVNMVGSYRHAKKMDIPRKLQKNVQTETWCPL